MRSPRLGAVYRVEGLVEEEAQSPGCVDPGWHVLVEGRVVPEEGEEVDDDEAEAGEGDGIGRHGEGEAADYYIVVEGLEDVPGDEGVVDAGVFV